MRRIYSGLAWAAIFFGVVLVVTSQGQGPDGQSGFGASESSLDGHPADCLACQQRGTALPAEIDDDTVWVQGGEVGGTSME